MTSATLLLPARKRLSGRPLAEPVARALGRSDRSVDTDDDGERAQLLRHFQLLPSHWPAAALTRQLDAGDATTGGWLRADPAWVRPDINGARLMAWGPAMELTRDDSEALLPALRPLFGDSGFPIDAPVPERWYLQLPREARQMAFAPPSEALGSDLLGGLPGMDDDSPEARRWRSLLNEAQIVLHNHPHNAVRVAAGKPPVNSLWLWGGGILPEHVSSNLQSVRADDALLRALALAAGVSIQPPAARFCVEAGNALFDLRGLRDPVALCSDWLQPALSALQDGTLARLWLDCEDGAGFMLERRQRWRFWRKPLHVLDA